MEQAVSGALPRRSADIITIGGRPRGPMTIEIVTDADLDAEQDAAAQQQVNQPDDRFDRNLAEDMDSSALAALAGSLLESIEADIQSRAEWEETANKASKYLGVKLIEPETSVSVDGTITKAVATCMLEANIKLWGTARAELLPVTGPVKVRREDVTQAPASNAGGAGIAPPSPMAANDGAPSPPMGAPVDADLTRDQLADALATDMNHYLTVTDREYYPDFSKMLRVRPLIGNAFRKVYRDPLKRRPVSVWVKAQDLIVSNDCSHLSGAGRRTERIRYRQAVMRRLQAMGHYLDVALSRPTGRATETEIAISEQEGIAPSPQLPEDFEHLVYECYCEVGSGTTSSLIGDLGKLDRDETGRKPGYPLPYRVSIDEDSRLILEIRRDWKKGDEDHKARTRYVKYGFIPGEGFYDYGLIHLVGNPTQVATMVQRAATDNTILANFPAWIFLKGPGSRQQNTVLRPSPGEAIGMDAAGAQRIQDVLTPLPYHDSSAGALAIIQKSEADVRRIAGVLEIPVGEGRIGNVPVGTIMSYIESIAQVPGAVHKDDHIAQQQEFELLRELFAEEPDALIRGNKTPARRWQTAQEILDPDLVPAADPNTPSQVHRIAKAQAIVTIAGLPQFMGKIDQGKVLHHVVEVISGGDGTQFDAPPQVAAPPPPDPRVVAAGIKAQSDTEKAQMAQKTEELKQQGKLAELQQEGQDREADRESAEVRAAMGVDAARLRATHDTVNAAMDRSQADTHHAQDSAQKDAHHQDELAAGFTAPFAPQPEGEEDGSSGF
jgi:hypothetical protein